jgi:hypothetical protein
MEASKYNIACPEGVIDGHLFTKEKRQELYGKIAGGGGSKKPENYQRQQIILGTGQPCPTTNIRINWRKHELVDISQPMKEDDGFDYTEDFDGKQVFDPIKVLINMKSVVGEGGSQTRTLRDQCYKSVDAQLNYLVKSKRTDIYFANIMDGDNAASKLRCFKNLLALPEYSSVCKNVYVGDLKGYFPWIKSIVHD